LLDSNFSIADHCILLSGVALYSNITLIFQEIVCWYEYNIRNFFKPEENTQSLLIIIIAEIRLGYTDFSLGVRNKYSQSKEKEFLLL